VACNALTFIPQFIKISHLVQELKQGTHRQYGHLVRLHFFLKKGKHIKNNQRLKYSQKSSNLQ